MMDEQLIDEVAHHGVIFNRQKYYLNGSSSGGKYETKDEAWQLIALKLRTDVETCKKRWKYLRERYVSQRKQGDPPVYEHLSRPYLEKMKFLDQHIQPRKSYRNVPNFLTSPQSANSSNYSEYNVDSKSNSSLKNILHFGGGATQNHHHHYQQHQQQSSEQQQHTMNALSSAAATALENVNGQVKIEAEIFRDFAAAVASQHISQSQMQQQQAAAVAAVMADSSQGYQESYRDNTVVGNGNAAQNSAGSTGGLTSTSSSMKSPLSSPLPGIGVNGVQDEQPASSSAQQQQQQQQQQQAAVHSSSSSIAGMASNMQVQAHTYNHKSSNDDLHSSTSSNYHIKKPRVQLNPNGGVQHSNSNNGGSMLTANGNNSHFVQDSDEESDDNSNDLMTPQTMLQHDNHYNNMQRNSANGNISNNNSSNNNQQQQLQQQQPQQQHQNMFPSNTDFLFQLYQQLPQQAGTSHASNFGKFQTPPNPAPNVMQRSSEHLLGELVTTELLKMNKDRRKNVQKRILEILFFDD